MTRGKPAAAAFRVPFMDYISAYSLIVSVSGCSQPLFLSTHYYLAVR